MSKRWTNAKISLDDEQQEIMVYFEQALALADGDVGLATDVFFGINPKNPKSESPAELIRQGNFAEAEKMIRNKIEDLKQLDDRPASKLNVVTSRIFRSG